MKQWDTIKFILVASVFLSLTGVGMYFYQVNNLKGLTAAIPRGQDKLTEIGKLTTEVDFLKKEIERDELQNLKPHVYVEQQANKAQISYRKYLDFKPLSLKTNDRLGYVDRPFEIIPQKKKKFDRRQIAKFLFNLENNTNRVKITKLILDNPNPENYEEWNMILEATERAPQEGR